MRGGSHPAGLFLSLQKRMLFLFSTLLVLLLQPLLRSLSLTEKKNFHDVAPATSTQPHTAWA
jgi:hypothetical protein